MGVSEYLNESFKYRIQKTLKHPIQEDYLKWLKENHT